MTKIGIITGSTRDARVNLQVAHYILENAEKMGGADFEIVDIKDYDLPLLNETVPAAMADRNYTTDDVKRWSTKIDSLDGFIFVTPEYNKNITPSLKNALDYLSPEWSNKAAGIVAYGSTLGVGATMILRMTLSDFNLATVGPFGAFSLFTDFKDMSTFAPSKVHLPTIKAVIETTVAWSTALKTVRN
ncbi:NADPH-dependent FMN reductase [Lacticigenium naphthae]|uniref:NADPH-dependent FMN reductase n=1 Tax=Lacticigenium naphthae TaxID=515351 RepID=UPI000402C0C4|nr:NAD(P)H-dependent oxidoreductase [Lacticigenium naphthae]